MVMVLVSLLFIILFLVAGLLSLNYSIFLWENKKVNDLTSRIKPSPEVSSNDALLQKNTASRGFTSLDMNDSVSVSRAIQTSNPGERMMSDISPNSELPTWVARTLDFLKKLRTNFWTQFINFSKYLISLAKPAEHVKEEDREKAEVKKAEVHEVIEKVINTPKEDVEDREDQKTVFHTNPKSSQSEVPEYKSSMATISFASGNDEKNELDMTMFEKMENKILQKLKEEGMNHYDIWVDLGKLYEKYNEKGKAKEVYALVLRHSQGNERDFARDRLIEIS